MNRKVVSLLSSLFVALAVLLWIDSPTTALHSVRRASPSLRVRAAQSSNQSTPVVRHLGLSQPLREAITPWVAQRGRVIPLLPVPHAPSFGQDPIVQISTAKTLPTTAGLNFEGVGDGAYGYTVEGAPPDANGAAGATEYVQWVNFAFAVFDKATGALKAGPTAGNALFTPYNTSGGSNCGLTNDGEPIVKYDAAAGRWVLAQISHSLADPALKVPFEECIAVSTSSEATGSYNLYTVQYQALEPDAVKFGIWSDGFYLAANLFNLDGSFFGSQGCAFDRNVFLAGGAPGPASVQCFMLDDPNNPYPNLQPSDLDGATSPPAGSPEFFMNLGVNSLNLWKFHVDFANPANTVSSATPLNIPVAAFNGACGGGGTCIPQPGTTQLLDSLGDRLMYRLAYRNFGDHEALVVNHSVTPFKQKRGPKSELAAGIRWYEIRDPNGTPAVYQQGTYAPDRDSRWMGSIATDKAGDIAVGFSVSSSTSFPSVRFTGRVPGDSLGNLEGEISIFEGSGAQTSANPQLSPLSRWGDYSSLSVDPVDDCTFYYTNEYLLADGIFNWNTRIASFKFPGCN